MFVSTRNFVLVAWTTATVVALQHYLEWEQWGKLTAVLVMSLAAVEIFGPCFTNKEKKDE